VFVAGGTAAFVHAEGLETDAKGNSDLGERDRLLDSADNYRLGGGVLFGVAATAVLAGVIKLAITDDPSPKSTGKVRASVHSTGSGIMVGLGTTF
jgi:hypothetical protein